jgi:hypothetical protein
MNVKDYISMGQLITVNRMLIIVGVGILTAWVDGRFMARRGLERESLWAKIFGGLLIVGGIGAWIAFMIWG